MENYNLPHFLSQIMKNQQKEAELRKNRLIRVLRMQNVPSIQNSKRRITTTLQQATTSEITKGRELPDPDQLGLAEGRRLEAAVLYNDLRGFSQLVATNPRRQVLLVLDAFVSEMVRAAREMNGEVVDCAGDRVMAIFWRPYGDRSVSPIHDAIKCAFWMQTIVNRALNSVLINASLPSLGCGIGIDYGTVVVARVGIRNRNKMVFLGSAANWAARLESYAQAGQTVLSDLVYKHRPDFMTAQNGWLFYPGPSWLNASYWTSGCVFTHDYPPK
jgi:class 3 adenylate cyclase